MIGRRLALLALLGTALVPAAASAKDKGRKSRERDRPRSPPSLRLETVDLVAGKAVAHVGGASRAPDPRLFSFHDDRGRHFIALYARCEPAPPAAVAADPDAPRSARPADDSFRCELDLPRAYLRANVLGMSLHLHGAEVSADEAEVRARFAAARRALPEAPVSAPAGPPSEEGDDPRRVGQPPPPPVDPGFQPARPGRRLPTQESVEETQSPEGREADD